MSKLTRQLAHPAHPTPWRVGGGLPPPEPETDRSVDGSEHENPEKTKPIVLHQKKSSFSIDGSVSPMVLVRLVKKWLSLRSN